MRRTLDTFKDSVSVIKKLGAEIGMEITDEDIARKMNISQEQFEGYLNAADKTPNEVIAQLWAAYENVFTAVQRSNCSASLRNIINLLKDLGKAKGMPITDEEIVGKIAIPRVQFDAYLNGEIATPEEVLSLFWSAWPDLLKNVMRVSSMQEDLGDAE